MLVKDDLQWDVVETDTVSVHEHQFDGSWRDWKAEGYKAIVRPDTKSVLGIHKARYEPVFNRDLREFAEIVQGESGASVAGSWSIKGGAVVGLQLQDGTYAMPGDPSDYQDFFVLGNSFDGSLPFLLHPTQVRIICQNTFYRALRERSKGGLGYVFKHTAGITAKVKEAQQAIQLAYQDRRKFLEWGEKLLKTPANQESFVAALIRDTESELEAAQQAVEEARETLRGVIGRATNDHIRDSAWGLFNAGVEYLDHFEKRRNTKNAKQAKMLRTIGFTAEKANRLRGALALSL
jgi:phage/plasmid-like protein (TIGR03299 family)